MSTASEIVEVADAIAAIAAKQRDLDAKEDKFDEKERGIKHDKELVRQQLVEASSEGERLLVLQHLASLQEQRTQLQRQQAELQRQQAALQEQRTAVQQQQLKQQTGATGVHRSWQSTFEPYTVMLLCAVCYCAFMLHIFLE
jgi:chromosome segregation ATPase